MKKILLSLVLLSVFQASFGQYDYKLNGRNDVPVLGGSTGLVAGGFTAMLKNRDDIDADARLDMEMMNFSYGGGLDQMWWFQPTIGFGFQLMYWNAGAAYSGLFDSANNITLSAKTSLTYFKVPLLFHFKSYNRYYPDRKVRFNASFGPYVALMTGYSDEYTLYAENQPGRPAVGGGSVSGTSVKAYNAGTSSFDETGTYKDGLYNPFELGFVFGVGGELRISRRTVLSILVRADIGISDVENKRKNKFKFKGTTTEVDQDPWGNLYSKYYGPNALDLLRGWEANRPATKNLSFGAFVTYKKYLRK
ncbi:MAG: hypothetical protein JNM95_07380 [Chitinophagaceae bacterium]|nr:hypothetical protein [Chitinophagaceae bacterium]